MDDNAPKENPPGDFNKLDLSQLQGFSFGTQWTQEKPAPADRRDQGGERPRRDGLRDSGGGPDRRDRRGFRRPAGPETAPVGGTGAPAGGPGGERRDFAGDRRPRQGGGDFRGGPRREGGGYGAGPGGPRPGGQGYGGQGGYAGRGAPQDRGPYESPYYTATFYPEDTSFTTLVQTIRKSCRTIELFEIARTVVAKTDRFVVVVAHRPAAAPAGAEPAVKPAKPVFHISVPDGIPFESDEAAVSHVLGKHLGTFFDTAEADVEPPKGNFQVINKCGLTGELLGPPNYHRYNQILNQHYAAKVASRMSLEAYRTRIETVRDPEVVNQWLEKMKKTTRYTWKLDAPKPAAAAPDAGPAPTSDGAAAESAPALPTTPTFDTLEDARLHLLTNARDKVVRTAETARFHGKVAETMPPGEIRRAIEGALERQRRFPLDTANALRGRLRREHFTIFKKGAKGVSYVCAVKRKFRVPGQTFADSIGALIAYIEAHPMVRQSELPSKFLGLSAVVAAKPVETPATAADVPAPDAPRPELTIDERAKLSRLQGDLMWLVREGYVTEFIDGRLFAPPPMVEARKKEVDGEEHDPENFPEVPPTSEAPAAETEAAPAEAPAPVDEAIAPPATGAEASEVAATTPVTTEPAAEADQAPAADPAPVEEPKPEPPAGPVG